MQKIREDALTAAITRLESALKNGKAITRLEKKRFVSLVESSHSREDIVSQNFMTVYYRCYEKKIVWNSVYLTSWRESQDFEIPAAERAEAIDMADAITSNYSMGNITMHLDGSGRLTHYSIILKNADVVEVTREDSEKMLSIYSACTLDITSQYFPTHNKDVLGQIVRALGGNKDCVTPPHVLKEFSSDDIVQYIIRHKKAGAMANFRKNSVKNLEKALTATIKEQAERLSLEDFVKETVAEVAELLRDRPRYEDWCPVFEFGKHPSEETLWLVISDLHIGKKDALPDGTETSTAIIKSRLSYIVEKFLREQNGIAPKKLKLLILGDILESPMFAGMHGEQFKKMETFGATQIMDAVNILEDFILSIAHRLQRTRIDVDIISGNHDRFADDRGDDVTRTGGEIVSAFLKKIIKSSNVVIEYHADGVISLNDDGINVIGFHGDNALIKRKAEEIHTVFSKDRNHHSVILNGHYHSFKSDENAQYTKIQMGSICSNDKYEMYQLGVRNTPSFLIFKHEKDAGIEWKKIPLPEKKKR